MKDKILKNKKLAIPYNYIKNLKSMYYVDDLKSSKSRNVPLKYTCHLIELENKKYVFSETDGQLIYVEVDDLILNEYFKLIDKPSKNKNEENNPTTISTKKPKQSTIDNVKSKFVNKKFNKLTCVEYLYTQNNLHYMKCTCECGNEKIISSQDLGSTKSCGCSRKNIKAWNKKEYLPFEKEIYSRYSGIRQRCYNENSRSYKWYGAKGVTMCDEWLNDFYSFYNWCIKNGFKNELHIDKDKICNKLGIYPHIYSPQTCMFITLEENNKHQSSNYKIEYEGIEYNLTDLSRKLGIDKITLQNRHRRDLDLLTGISNKDVLDKLKNGYEYISIMDLSKELNTGLKYLRDRLLKDISFKMERKRYVFLQDLKNKKINGKVIYESIR